jgi:hypothetical protein
MPQRPSQQLNPSPSRPPARLALAWALLGFAALGLLLATLLLDPPTQPPADPQGLPETAQTAAGPTHPTERIPADLPLDPEPPPGSPHPQPTAPTPISQSTQIVFRLILEDGTCSLDAVEQVQGQFRSRRAAPEVHAGMIACRLLGPNHQIIAERWLHPPDHVCAVLDTTTAGTATNPRALTLAGIGPQVFQVHFPAALRGQRMDVYRIHATHPNLQETLLLSVPLQP